MKGWEGNNGERREGNGICEGDQINYSAFNL
jgi:hypothetical protein